MSIADLRQEYLLAGLTEADAERDPIRQFERWFQEALDAGVPLANAMTLATVSADGAPDARIVLLKGIESGSCVFYTNYDSRKGRQLAQRPVACLVFLWTQLERQVRIEGVTERVSAEDSDAYFRSRPLGSRLSAWASRQSEPVPDREHLERALAQMESRFGTEPPRPAQWGGYRLAPQAVEFWQGRENRLHDRIRYRRGVASGGVITWAIDRLAP